MTDQAYGEWVNAHVTATGGEPVRLTELLWANREVIVTRLTATYPELCECTQRLIEGARVPQFPSEHPNAIVKELRAYRAELARHESTNRNVVPAGHRLKGCDCPDCNGGEVLPSYQRATDKLRVYLKEHKELTGGIFKSIPGRK